MKWHTYPDVGVEVDVLAHGGGERLAEGLGAPPARMTVEDRPERRLTAYHAQQSIFS